MPKINQEIIDSILDKVRIEDVVSDFVELKKKGVRYLGICPFHDDHNIGSFVVYPKKNCYRCFACDARGGAIDFLMQHAKMSYPDAIRYLGKKYSIDVDNLPVNFTPPPPRPVPEPLPTLVLPRHLLETRLDNQGDTLCTWIRHLPWDEPQRARVEPTLRDYCVGHSIVTQERTHQEHHFTVFWQVDAQGHLRTGHYMKYKPDGHRMKKEQTPYHTDWFHALLERHNVVSIYDPEKQEPRQCLFGEHLLSRYPGATVCLVESEKTAVLMAIAYGNNPMQIWMACCGASNINRDRLEPIIKQNRRIVLYPDRDGIDYWTERAKALNYDRVAIDTRAVTQWWHPDDGPKADIADVVIRIIKEGHHDMTDHEKELAKKLNAKQVTNETSQRPV